jgi:hypothetical protein
MSRIGIAVLFIIESAAFLIGIYMAINSACHPADDVIFIGDITAGQVLANGKVASIHSLTEPRKSVISKFPGRDVSGMFPSLIYLGHPPGQDPDKYTDPAITACIGNRFRSADRWLNSYISQMNYSLDLTRCPMPDGKPGPCFYQPEHISDLKGAVVGGMLRT